MSRRRQAVKRVVLPDSQFNSVDVAKFINIIMIQGKKSTAQSIFYNALNLASERVGEKDLVKVLIRH